MTTRRSRASRLRARTLVTVSAMLLPCLTGAVPARAMSTAAASNSTGAPGLAEGPALAEARRTGRPVEVDTLATADTKVVADPGGTFTATMYTKPVRVRTATGWVPVDTTLTARPDGTVAPKATVVPVTFSGGGSAPLARAARDGASFGLDWASSLPKPQLRGDTATYPDILPGVDLKLTATATGYAETLVVRDATAARNPALRTLRFGLRTTGAAAPSTRGPAGSVDQKGRTNAVDDTTVGWEVDGDTLAVRPNAALDNPATAYPLEMDGPKWGEKLHWMLLSQNTTTGAKAAYWDSQHVGRVGRAPGEATRWRSYYEMNTAPIAGKHILSAKFQIYEWWAESCTRQPVELWHIGTISPATTWGDSTMFVKKAAEIAEARGYDASCDRSLVGFDIGDLVAEAANGRWPTVTVALKAREDATATGAKEFLDRPVPELGMGPDDLVLGITAKYNTIPDRATGLTVAGTACSDTGAVVVSTATPTVEAVVSDPDTGLGQLGQDIRGVFRWWEDTGGPPTDVASAASPYSTPGKVSAEVPPDKPLRDGVTYVFGVTVEDKIDSSDGKPWCRFTVDTTRPAAPPTVSSSDFPAPPAAGPPVYTPGRFTFDAGGDRDVVGFWYGFGRSPATLTDYVAANAPGGTATISYTPNNPSSFTPLSLDVVSEDRARNRSAAFRTYRFNVAPVITATTVYANWEANSVSGGKLLDLTSKPNAQTKFDATISGTITPAKDRANTPGTAVHLDGTASYAATAAPVAPKTGQNTFGSFTVMAWVKLDRAVDWATAVSQDGSVHSGFALKYNHYPRSWQFSMEGVDATDGRSTAAADSRAMPQLGVWTHLAGVYDHTAGRMSLYVNGRLAGQTNYTSTWYASGPTALGRARYNGLLDDFWPGDLDDMRIYPWVASEFEVRDRMKGGTFGPDAEWSFDEGSGQTSADATTNGHTLALYAGASWATPGRSGTGSAMRFDGQEGHAYTSGPVAPRSADGTYGSFTVMGWVRLTRLDRWAWALSQDGLRDSGFVLGYSSYPRGWSFGMSATDSDEGGGDGYVVSDVTPQAGVWTHLAGVYDHTAGAISLYVNGRLAKSMAHRSTWYGDGAFQVGRARNNGWLTDFWPGEVDDVKISAGAKPVTDIVAAMAGPNYQPGANWALDDNTTDATGHGHTLGLWNGASWTAGRYGSGLRFDGVEGHAYTVEPVVRPDQDFTVASWVRLDTVDRPQTVVSQEGPRDSGFRLLYDKSTNAWTFTIAGNTRDGGTVPDGTVRGTTVPRPGEWTHLTGVYSKEGKRMSLFVNGRLQASAPYTSVARADQALTVGRARNDGWWIDYLGGTVDDVRLRDTAASAVDVFAMTGLDVPSWAMSTPVPIGDLAVAESPNPVFGATPDMASNLLVSVSLRHTYRGDLTLSLVAPDNTVYPLEDLKGTGDVDDLTKTYRFNASGELVNGTWKLRVEDTVLGDTGTIDHWSISAPVTNVPPPAVAWPKINGPGFTVANNTTTERSVTVAGIPGNGPTNLNVAVDRTWSWPNDLKIVLVAPDAKEYVLHDGSVPASPQPDDACGEQPDPYEGRKNFFVNVAVSPANGVWKLRVIHSGTSGAPTITAWSLSSSINLEASSTAPDTKFAQPDDVPIDQYYTSSSARACGVPGTDAKDLRVAVDIRHPNRGDLKLELEAPDGAGTYLLEDIPDTDSGDDVRKVYTVPGVAQLPNGYWYLRVTDTRNDWTGVINEWGVQILPSSQAVPPPGWKKENTTDVPIVDDGWTESPITVPAAGPDDPTGLAGMAPKAWRVSVDIKHTHRGDLALYLEAPDGTGYLLEDMTGGGDVDNLVKSYTVNASAEIASGVWKLKVCDAVWGDTGFIDSWSLSAPDFTPASTGLRTPVADLGSAESPLTVSGAGNAPNGMRVQATITHAKPEQLVISLVAPDGTVYTLQDRRPTLPASYRVDAAAETLDGTWRLRVQDTVSGEVGAIESWGLVLAPAVAWPEQRGSAFKVTGPNGSGQAQVTRMTGNAPADLRLSVTMSYYWVSDLKVSLVAPDGSSYVVHDHAPTMPSVFTVDAQAEVANGLWKLEVVRDGASTVDVTAWSLWSPVNQQATPSGPVTKFANGDDQAIPDDGWSSATSPVLVAGLAGAAANDLRVTVDIKHPNRGDLTLSLRAPGNAATYLLEDVPDSDTGDDLFRTYTLPRITQPANGYWNLVVTDTKTGNKGTIDGWSIQVLPSP